MTVLEVVCPADETAGIVGTVPVALWFQCKVLKSSYLFKVCYHFNVVNTCVCRYHGFVAVEVECQLRHVSTEAGKVNACPLADIAQFVSKLRKFHYFLFLGTVSLCCLNLKINVVALGSKLSVKRPCVDSEVIMCVSTVGNIKASYHSSTFNIYLYLRIVAIDNCVCLRAVSTTAYNIVVLVVKSCELLAGALRQSDTAPPVITVHCAIVTDTSQFTGVELTYVSRLTPVTFYRSSYRSSVPKVLFIELHSGIF